MASPLSAPCENREASEFTSRTVRAGRYVNKIREALLTGAARDLLATLEVPVGSTLQRDVEKVTKQIEPNSPGTRVHAMNRSVMLTMHFSCCLGARCWIYLFYLFSSDFPPPLSNIFFGKFLAQYYADIFAVIDLLSPKANLVAEDCERKTRTGKGIKQDQVYSV